MDDETPRRWPHVGSERLASCAVFEVSRVMTRSPRTGRVHPFYCIDADPWVNVVALTPEDELVMVRQYRHGARDVTLEIPGGMVDPGEAPAEAGVRELREETGYCGADPIPLGVVNPNPALFTNSVHTFLIRDAVRVGDIQNEGHEETVVELLPRRHLHDRIRRGDVAHALVMAALHWFELSDY